MKKTLLMMMLLFASYVFADSTSDFDFYKSIPKYESITLNGQDILIVIKSNYTVSMSASKRENDTQSKLSGDGTVIWDPSEQRLYLQLNGKISGSYSRQEEIYRTEKKYNVGSTTLNGLFGSGTADYYRYEKVYDHTEYYNASGSDEFSVKLPIYISDDKNHYTLNKKSFSTTLKGNTSVTISFLISGEQKSLKYGSILSTSNTIKDEFGAWKWTKDKSIIYLFSTNIQSNKLSIIRDSEDEAIMLQLYFGEGKINGSSVSNTDAGRLLQFNFSFDDGSNVTLPFLEQSGNLYTYATYNRFLEEWNMNAKSIINQLKDKQMIIVTYTINNTSSSAIFELEGLEAIMSYL